MKALEKIISAGRALVLGTVMAAACTPAVRAQRDYDLYPARKAEIALYNMKQIAGQICGPPGQFQVKPYPYCDKMSFSKQGMEYVEKRCVMSQYQVSGGVGGMACVTDEDNPYSIYWDEIQKIIPARYSVKICSEGKKCITINEFRNNEQATDFAEAMNIYVMER